MFRRILLLRRFRTDQMARVLHGLSVGLLVLPIAGLMLVRRLGPDEIAGRILRSTFVAGRLASGIVVLTHILMMVVILVPGVIAGVLFGLAGLTGGDVGVLDVCRLLGA